MSVPALLVFISSNSCAYNGWKEVLNSVLYMYKMREVLSLVLYVGTTMKVLWDCEVGKPPQNCSVPGRDYSRNACWKSGPTDFIWKFQERSTFGTSYLSIGIPVKSVAVSGGRSAAWPYPSSKIWTLHFLCECWDWPSASFYSSSGGSVSLSECNKYSLLDLVG